MEVFEMVTKQTEPDLDAWKQQEERQRKTARNRKAGAIAIVAAIAAAVVIVFVATRPFAEDSGRPAGEGTGNNTATVPAGFGLDPQARTVVGLDGTTISQVPGLPEDAFGLSLSAGGSTIAFVTESDGQNHIATIGMDGQGMRVLGAGFEPAISPDASKIAFVRNYDIYVMNADGSGERRIVGNPHVDEFPQWSPDGTTIVYDNYASKAPTDSGFSPNSSIMMVPAGGGSKTRVAQGGTAGEPTYSPDGTQIAFRGDHAIWAMNTDGSDMHAVAPDAGVVDGPRWSPDGTKIAFSTYNGDWRANVQLGVYSGDRPVGDVQYVDVATGEIFDAGDVTIVTWWNAPNWLPSGDALLVNAVRQT
jgi:Tol biopolymer transport system component